MPYEFDVFLSYMHDEQMGGWVEQHFVPFLRSFVGNALNRPVSIFLDRSGIRTGDSWPLRLQQAIAKSRCLVAIWAPLYFHSEWCRRECMVMLNREAQFGFRTANVPHGLVVPVNVFDGEHFPDKARDLQWFDCRKYWRTGRGFSDSPRYMEFQDDFIEWAPDVARAVQAAPDWDDHWLTAPWLDVSDADLMPQNPQNFSFRGLE